jgi:beta-galactosidase
MNIFLRASWRAVARLTALAFMLTGGLAVGKEQGRPQTGRVEISIETNWCFFQGDAVGAQRLEWDDSGWRLVDVPHDWSIEGTIDATNTCGGAGGFLPTGVGWYRKHFTLPPELSGRRIYVEFDGVMANSEVWINGVSMGQRPCGYVSFRYELTEHVGFGQSQTNVLAVRADTEDQPASRWYAGSGIYRHVRLIAASGVHLELGETFVTTPRIGATNATVSVRATVTNSQPDARTVCVRVSLRDGKGREVASGETAMQTVPGGQRAEFENLLVLNQPRRWDISDPALYEARVSLEAEALPVSESGRKLLDSEQIPFGVREFRFEPETGFWLNGRNLKIKGVCVHHDGGALGAAVPLRAWERRLERLKALGCNAIRTAHNPPAPEFLDVCDRLGLLVMDEMFDCWTVAKNPYDYHLYFNDWADRDLRDTVKRDRNHPCIVVYSAGNEIHDTPKTELANRILRGLVKAFHETDPTRPVTQGLFRPNVSHDYNNGLADLLDVVGQNYRENEILAAHLQKPERKILGTENGHDLKVWLALRDNPPYAGQFLWTGIDYLGEARRWPTIASGSGLLDRTGAIRARGYQRQSWWSEKPMVRLIRRTEASGDTPADPGFDVLARPLREFADWTPRNAGAHKERVEAFSNCDMVELFLNGKSLGKQPRPADDSARSWEVDYVPGTLKAVGWNRARKAAVDELRTAGRASRVVLNTDKVRLAPVWDDVAYVEATVVDDYGVLVPEAGDLVQFAVAGQGRVVAVDSGDIASHEAFQAAERKAYRGKCVAIVRGNADSGRVTVTAGAKGLKSGTVKIELCPASNAVR